MKGETLWRGGKRVALSPQSRDKGGTAGGDGEQGRDSQTKVSGKIYQESVNQGLLSYELEQFKEQNIDLNSIINTLSQEDS